MEDTTNRKTGPLAALRDAWTYIHAIAEIIKIETTRTGDPEPTTEIGRAIVEAIKGDGSIDLERLQTIAHHHPQKGIAMFLYPHLIRKHQIDQKWHEDASIAHSDSAWKGADALANAYTITRDITAKC